MGLRHAKAVPDRPRLGHYPKSRLGLDQQPQALADDRVVVGQHDGDVFLWGGIVAHVHSMPQARQWRSVVSRNRAPDSPPI